MAIKAFEREEFYRRERDVYLRLRENQVCEILGCAVPQLVDFDDELWVVEMTFVSRPFVLDFAGAFLDWDPGFSEEQLAEWRAEKLEEFGTRLPTVEGILLKLRELGIYMTDVHPNNISWPD